MRSRFPQPGFWTERQYPVQVRGLDFRIHRQPCTTANKRIHDSATRASDRPHQDEIDAALAELALNPVVTQPVANHLMT
jgi:hypothetical protein